MAKGYSGNNLSSAMADKYMAALEEGNRRNPLYYDAIAFLNNQLCGFLERVIDNQAKILPVHTGDREFRYVRQNGHKVLKLEYGDAIWLLKHILSGEIIGALEALKCA